jgi:hypothetical protein
MTAAIREHTRSLIDLRVRAIVGEPAQVELVRFCSRCGCSFDIEPGGKSKLCEVCRSRRRSAMPHDYLLRQRALQRALDSRRAAQRCASRA